MRGTNDVCTCPAEQALCLKDIASAVFSVEARGDAGDPSLPLRLLASVHRRGVELLEAHFLRSSHVTGTEKRISFSGRFKASGPQALTVLHTIDAVIGIEHVELKLDSVSQEPSERVDTVPAGCESAGSFLPYQGAAGRTVLQASASARTPPSRGSCLPRRLPW